MDEIVDSRYVDRLEAEVERLREVAQRIIDRYDAGRTLTDAVEDLRAALTPADTGGEGCIGGPHRRGSAPGSCADCEAAVDGYTGEQS